MIIYYMILYDIILDLEDLDFVYPGSSMPLKTKGVRIVKLADY